MSTSSHDAPRDLVHGAAIEKIRDLAKAAHACFFGTFSEGVALDVRPMAVESVDDAGNLWFLSGRSSEKNREIQRDARVQLLFANPGKSEYLTLRGRATISDSRALREKHWNKLAKTWFPGGVDDPELTVIRVQPEEGRYWDTEYGKTVTMLKLAVGAITGHAVDVGVHGTVKP